MCQCSVAQKVGKKVVIRLILTKTTNEVRDTYHSCLATKSDGDLKRNEFVYHEKRLISSGCQTRTLSPSPQSHPKRIRFYWQVMNHDCNLLRSIVYSFFLGGSFGEWSVDAYDILDIVACS